MNKADFPEDKADVLPRSLIGQRVVVVPGRYRVGGEGVIERDRGVGLLRVVEARMSNKKIQITAIDNIQLVEAKP